MKKAVFPKFLKYFSGIELTLWCFSVGFILLSFLIFDRESYLTLAASLIGVTSLIFSAKGNPVGQGLMIIFSLLYGIISFACAYYGEVITYLGMAAPMELYALISWIKNPYGKKRSQVKVNNISVREFVLMLIFNLAITTIFYFILKFFNTDNLIVSTISVSTSFAAVYLTARRSPYFAIAYALNDLVLIVLWIVASVLEPSYISVVICFAVFMINDIYGFFAWKRMRKAQEQRDGNNRTTELNYNLK